MNSGIGIGIGISGAVAGNSTAAAWGGALTAFFFGGIVFQTPGFASGKRASLIRQEAP